MVILNKKRIFWTSVVVVLLVLLLIYLRLDEDAWIKDSRGRWIEHGKPVFVPEEVKEQQSALSCASELYANENFKNSNLSSQCLGACGEYSVDLVNVPRTSEDDKTENQCVNARDFIELDKDGNIVRIVS